MAETENNESREDIETRTRLEHIQREYELWSMRAYKTLLAVVVVQVVLGAASIFLWTKIQDSRRDTVRIACEDTNGRHDKALVKLNKVFDDAVKAGKVKEEEVASAKAANTLLIEAIVPNKNCADQVNRLVK